MIGKAMMTKIHQYGRPVRKACTTTQICSPRMRTPMMGMERTAVNYDWKWPRSLNRRLPDGRAQRKAACTVWHRPQQDSIVDVQPSDASKARDRLAHGRSVGPMRNCRAWLTT